MGSVGSVGSVLVDGVSTGSVLVFYNSTGSRQRVIIGAGTPGAVETVEEQDLVGNTITRRWGPGGVNQVGSTLET